jgi:hypothetical protein
MNDLRHMNAVCPDYNPWPSQGARVVIWSEKSLGGTLKPILDEYLVSFHVQHGNTSDTVIHKAAEWCRQHPTMVLVILYVGDHDPKGLRISEEDIHKRLGGDEGITNYIVHRVAILRSDVEAVRREDRDAFKPKDPDIAWYVRRTGLSYGVEVEAIPSTELRDRVEAAIKAEITNAEAWHRTINASQTVRESWQEYVQRWPMPAISPLGSE